MKSLVFVFSVLFVGSLFADDKKSVSVKVEDSAESCEEILKSFQNGTWDRIRILNVYLDDAADLGNEHSIERAESGEITIKHKANEYRDPNWTNVETSEATITLAESVSIVELFSPTVISCRKHYENGETDLGTSIVAASSHLMGVISVEVGKKIYSTRFNSQFLEKPDLEKLFKGTKILRELSKPKGK